MSCFSSEKLKMQVLKYMSKYPTNRTGKSEELQRSREHDFRLQGKAQISSLSLCLSPQRWLTFPSIKPE